MIWSFFKQKAYKKAWAEAKEDGPQGVPQFLPLEHQCKILSLAATKWEEGKIVFCLYRQTFNQ